MTRNTPELRYPENKIYGLIGPSWAIRLTAVGPGFAIPVILLAYMLSYIYHPELFNRGFPTISRSFAFHPSTQIFAVGMGLAASAMFFVWPLFSFILTHHRTKVYVTDSGDARRIHVLAKTGGWLGLLAAMSLLGLSIINSNLSWTTHLIFCIIFYPSMLLAIIIDSVVSLRLRRASRDINGGEEAFSTYGKPLLAIFIAIATLIFFFTYFSQEFFVIFSKRADYNISTMSEFSAVMLMSVYPSLYYWEHRDYFGQSELTSEHQ